MAIQETSNSILRSVAQVPEHEPKPSTTEEEVEQKKEDDDLLKPVVDFSRLHGLDTY